MNFNNLIYNIDVLNNIKLNEKLCLKDYILIIDKPRCTRPIYRFLNRQNREKIYLFFLKLIDNISLELTKFKYYKCGMSYFKLEDLNIQSPKDYSIIAKKMDDLRNAIDKLKLTYKSSKEYVKKLELLKNKVTELNPDYRILTIY
tara:strand:+ start:777 stop:1211 length:435 start_codon:yes stop_codon:yes gene_type:complete